MSNFNHLPFRIRITVPLAHVYSPVDPSESEWCYEHVEKSWDMEYGVDEGGFHAQYYFESEDDALIFKLTWFK